MKDVKERWVELCERASVEQDSRKLQELLREIDRLLREKRKRIDEAGAVTRGIDGKAEQTGIKNAHHTQDRSDAPDISRYNS